MSSIVDRQQAHGRRSRFDLVVKGGTVVDPSAGLNGSYDIGVNRGRITAVEPMIPTSEAIEIVDATGTLVVPGLIDLHSHIYPDATFWGVDADALGSQSGVTTWVDAGSCGAFTLQGFRRHIIDRAKTRILAFVNISGIGLTAQNYELSHPEFCNIELLEKVVARHRDIVAGVKIRAGRSGQAQDLLPFHRARRAADELDLPLMMHISEGPPAVEAVLPFLRPGDIITHCSTGWSMKLIDDSGNLLPAARKALDSGVILDLGHGAGSLSFESAEALLEQGCPPEVISTDIHQLSIHGPNLVSPHKASGAREVATDENSDAQSVVFSFEGDGTPALTMLTCMDKMLCIGMSFEDVIAATTSRPAEILGIEGEVGTLKPGANADITALTMESGSFSLVDVHGTQRIGKTRLRHEFTLLGGRRFERIEMPPPPPWIVPEGADNPGS